MGMLELRSTSFSLEKWYFFLKASIDFVKIGAVQSIERPNRSLDVRSRI